MQPELSSAAHPAVVCLALSPQCRMARPITESPTRRSRTVPPGICPILTARDHRATYPHDATINAANKRLARAGHLTSHREEIPGSVPHALAS